MITNKTKQVSDEALLSYFLDGCKGEGDLRIGGEYELFPVEPETGAAIPFSGDRGVGRILERLLEKPDWSPVFEGDALICLLGRDGSNITLEPGAQVELSGAPRKRLRDLATELQRFLRELHYVSRDLKVDFIGMGMQPVSQEKDIPFIKKCRYAIMAPYLQDKGSLAHTMMKETATVQVNLDYTGEADAMDKLKTVMGITSLVSAMFANSPLSGGKPNGFMTRREHVWQDTDPDRCGLLPFVFDREASFQDYLDYALHVPMMLLIREGCCIPMHGIPFRRFWREGVPGIDPVADDWALHLSTLFPEARLKQYIEIRGVDGQAPGMVLSVPAFWKGILYHSDARLAAWEMVQKWSLAERLRLHQDVCRLALKAKVGRSVVLDLASELVRIAAEGLRLQGETDAYLAPLEDLILKQGKCPAEVVLEKWDRWKPNVSRLVRYASYFQSAVQNS